MKPAIDADEIGQLLRTHGAALEIYASQWTHGADDCTQEAFIKLATTRTRPDHPVAWLYRVVRNLAINYSRSSNRRKNHEQQAAALNTNRSKPALRETASITDALKKLPVDQRELIVLRIWSNLTWQQISELTETSSSSAQRKYVSALQRVKEILESCPKILN